MCTTLIFWSKYTTINIQLNLNVLTKNCLKTSNNFAYKWCLAAFQREKVTLDFSWKKEKGEKEEKKSKRFNFSSFILFEKKGVVKLHNSVCTITVAQWPRCPIYACTYLRKTSCKIIIRTISYGALLKKSK